MWMFADNLLNYFYEGLLWKFVKVCCQPVKLVHVNVCWQLVKLFLWRFVVSLYKLVKVCCQPVKFVLCEGLLITCKISLLWRFVVSSKDTRYSSFSAKSSCHFESRSTTCWNLQWRFVVKVCCQQLNLFYVIVVSKISEGLLSAS